MKGLVFLIFFISGFLHPLFAEEITAAEIDNIAQGLFVGQVYPSGNIYIKSFVGDARSGIAWPATISLIAVVDHPNRFILPSQGGYQRILHDKRDGEKLRTTCIPCAEGIDVSSRPPCGLEIRPAHPPIYRLLSGDFFESINGHCESTEGVGVYRTAPSSYSFLVVAIADSLPIAENWVSTTAVSRPLQPQEEIRVAREKSTEPIGYECTTVPQFLDSARIRLEVEPKDVALKIRISSYKNAGCSGHLSEIFILDLWDGQEQFKSYELIQYRGNL